MQQLFTSWPKSSLLSQEWVRHEHCIPMKSHWFAMYVSKDFPRSMLFIYEKIALWLKCFVFSLRYLKVQRLIGLMKTEYMVVLFEGFGGL